MTNSEWYTTTLGECANLISGGTPSKQKPEYWGGTIPWVSAKDMKQFRLYQTEDYITEKGTENGTRVVPAGTIFILVRGMTLHNDIPISIIKRDMAFNQDVKAIQPNPLLVDVEYLAYCLLANKPHLMSLVDSASHGTGRINTDILKAVQIELPPLPEQKAIAHILGTLDDKIELNREMNKTLEAMAQAIFKSWFVDFDPVRAKMEGRQPAGMDAATAELFPDEFEESALGMIPKGWRIKQINTICDVSRGASPRPIHDYIGGEVPWIKIADATAAEGLFIFETKQTIKREGVSKSVPVYPGDLILSNSATCGVPMFVELKGCIHDGWLLFRNLKTISKGYLYHHLYSISQHLIHIADGSVQKNLNTKLVGEQLLVLPPEAIVKAFDGINNNFLGKIRSTILESRTLASIRDTLLSKLLSGEIRVKEAEKVVEEVT